MEALLGFVAGIMLTPWALAALFILGIFAEHNDSRGWSVFFALIAMGVSYFFFGLPLMTIAIGAAGYLVIGLVWSFWRYKRFVQKAVDENKNAPDITKEAVLRRIHPKAMLGTITAWIMVWPFSFVESIAGDLINAIQSLVTKIFRGIYHKIYDSAVSALKP